MRSRSARFWGRETVTMQGPWEVSGKGQGEADPATQAMRAREAPSAAARRWRSS
jgi:hypothetical protein